ncbi:putative amino acid ABC transporter, permease protein [Pseudomonas fluorescens]|uniref:Putative amino acid ABC transporter, permease protein n=1 Tax=Pseudomonas fluorescens TaxID=294 RepID=A0A0P8XNC5_PSEFL|nr:putative amino acid ABC transporter, permease protein [Pseudomonas fluorescens]
MVAQCLNLHRLFGVDPVVHCPGFIQVLLTLARTVLHLPVSGDAALYPVADLLHRDLQPGCSSCTTGARCILSRRDELHHPCVCAEHLRLHHGDFRRSNSQHGPWRSRSCEGLWPDGLEALCLRDHAIGATPLVAVLQQRSNSDAAFDHRGLHCNRPGHSESCSRRQLGDLSDLSIVRCYRADLPDGYLRAGRSVSHRRAPLAGLPWSGSLGLSTPYGRSLGLGFCRRL